MARSIQLHLEEPYDYLIDDTKEFLEAILGVADEYSDKEAFQILLALGRVCLESLGNEEVFTMTPAEIREYLPDMIAAARE